jgi:type IV pilus assembly protein PilM
MAVTVGLDVGSSSVRAVAIDTGKADPVLRKVGSVDLPDGAVVSGEIIDGAAVVDAIKELWRKHRLPKKRVILGLANQRVVVRQVDVPLMGEAELREALPFQVQEYMPMSVEEAILDHIGIEEFTTPDGEPMQSILAVAAHRSMVQDYLDVTTSAGLNIFAVDLQAFALVRSLIPSSATDLAVIVDIGTDLTQVVLVDGQVPRFVRIIQTGGETFTKALVDGLGVDAPDAEALKRRIGVSVEDQELPVADDESQDETAQRLLTVEASRFIEEIRGSVNFYLSQADGGTLARVIVAGNGARLPHLANRLGRTLDASVEPARVLSSLSTGKLSDEEVAPLQPVLPVPVGLALWRES